MALSNEAVTRFWSKVDRSGGPNACWPWTAACDQDGYGAFKSDGVQRRAHRVAWMLSFGEIAEGLRVCHSCDNPCCCNPAHLWLGTDADNAADRGAKGRTATGERVTAGRRSYRGSENPRAVLTAGQAAAIRHALATGGRSQQAIADSFGVSQTLVSQIARGIAWRADAVEERV